MLYGLYTEACFNIKLDELIIHISHGWILIDMKFIIFNFATKNNSCGFWEALRWFKIKTLLLIIMY